MIVTLEGIDGSGKSTQARLLVERLQAEGYSTVLVRDPGGTLLSERIRDVLLDREDSALRIDPIAEVLLFSAARAQLVEERIRPALADGFIVVCDRFYDSTTAYQAVGREVDADWVRALNVQVTRGLVPDRTYLIDLPVQTAFERLREIRPDRMEEAGEGFYRRVAQAYRQLARSEERFLIVDGDRPTDVIHQDLWSDLHVLLPAPSTTTAPEP